MQDTLTIRDLMQRYSCAASTIYRRMKKDAYPKPSRFGKGKNKWSTAAVFAWEKIHMPHLHIATDAQFEIADAEKWQEIQRDYTRSFERDLEGRPKAKQKKTWEDIRRELAAVKKRHGGKPVAFGG